MLKEQTIEKLRKLRLQPIIESVKSMESAPETNSMTHDEWLDVIVGHLYEAKNSKKLVVYSLNN